MAHIIKMVRCYVCGQKTPWAPTVGEVERNAEPPAVSYQLCHECAGARPDTDDGWGDTHGDHDIYDSR